MVEYAVVGLIRQRREDGGYDLLRLRPPQRFRRHPPNREGWVLQMLHINVERQAVKCRFPDFLVSVFHQGLQD